MPVGVTLVVGCLASITRAVVVFAAKSGKGEAGGEFWSCVVRDGVGGGCARTGSGDVARRRCVLLRRMRP